MFTRALFTAAAVLASTVCAQNSSGEYTVDPNSVSAATRESWCGQQQSNCQIICDGQAYPNTCDPTSLVWDCTCVSGAQPNISDYAGTVPSNECIAWRTNCIASNAQNSTAQEECMDVICGNKVASESTSSAAPSSTSAASTTASLTTTTTGSASQSSSTSHATSSGAAMALGTVEQYGTGLFASSLLAIFGLLL